MSEDALRIFELALKELNARTHERVLEIIRQRKLHLALLKELGLV